MARPKILQMRYMRAHSSMKATPPIHEEPPKVPAIVWIILIAIIAIILIYPHL